MDMKRLSAWFAKRFDWPVSVPYRIVTFFLCLTSLLKMLLPSSMVQLIVLKEILFFLLK